MKFPARHLALVFAVFSVVSVALAHPGHDDGHELTWELGHLAAHPLATFGCLAIFVGAGWGGWKLVQRLSASREARAESH
jgi:urease accessory protein